MDQSWLSIKHKALAFLFQTLFPALLPKKYFIDDSSEKLIRPNAAVAVKFTCFEIQAFQIMNLQQRDAKQDKIEEPFSAQVWLRDSLLDNWVESQRSDQKQFGITATFEAIMSSFDS